MCETVDGASSLTLAAHLRIGEVQFIWYPQVIVWKYIQKTHNLFFLTLVNYPPDLNLGANLAETTHKNKNKTKHKGTAVVFSLC